MIRIRRNEYGRGIYATKPIKRGQIIEVAPLIVLKDRPYKKMGKLSLYVFNYRPKKGYCCVALGYGSLFNHSKDNNVSYKTEKDSITFRASKNIGKGEQLFIDYGYDPKRWLWLHDE